LGIIVGVRAKKNENIGCPVRHEHASLRFLKRKGRKKLSIL
jgi:hypothetical protein